MSPGIRRGLGFALGWLALAGGGAVAADDGFEAQSVALRTLLHHDAALDAPFRDLVALYRRAGREPELRTLYENHLTRYPADLGARAVWIRLLADGDVPEAAERAREAARAHPEHSGFHYLVYVTTGELGPLERSVALETVEARRSERLRELAGAATGEAERALVEAAWRRELGVRSGQSVDAVREVGGWMRGTGYPGLAWEAMDKAWELGPVGEIEVELAAEAAAWAEADRDAARGDQARGRLGSLRERLAADHPRREEVVLAWWRLGTDRTRPADEAVATWRSDPTAAAHGVDAAILLEAAGRVREAADLWLEVASLHPALGEAVAHGRALLRDDAEGWMAFLDKVTERGGVAEDLVRERVVLEFRSAGAEAGQRRLEDAIAGLSPDERARFRIALGEELLAAALPEAAADCLGRVVADGNGGFPASAGWIRALAACGDGAALRRALSGLVEGSGTEDEWLALAARLEEGGWEPEAADLIRRMAMRSGASVTARLSLLDRQAGEDVGERLEGLRREELSGDDYRRWLIAMAEWWAGRGQPDEPWIRESARLAEEIAVGGFDPGTVGRWSVFAQVARSRSQGERLRELADAAVPPGSNVGPLPVDVMVRRLVAEAWELDPWRVLDAERLLLALEQEDTSRSDEYRARLALLAERAGRREVALERLQRVDGGQLGDAGLVVAAADLAERAGLGSLEGRFRARLVSLLPGDAGAWERHLAVLLRDGDEADFRAGATALLGPAGALELGDSARLGLEDGIFASWQRELADASPERRQGLLRGLLRDSPNAEVRAWAEACQAWERWRRGEVPDADATPLGLVDRDSRIGAGTTVNWAVLAAIRGESAKDSSASGAATETVRRLLGPGWVFRCRPGRRVLAICAGETHLMAVDDHFVVRALDGLSGKVRWVQAGARPSGLGASPGDGGTSLAPSGTLAEVAAPPALEAWGGLIFTADDRRVMAWEEQTGRLAWETSFGSARSGITPLGRVRCPIRLARAGEGRLVVLVPEEDRLAALESRSGKVLWEQETFPGLASAGPLGCGLAADGAFVAVLGNRLSVHGAADGRRAWSRQLGEPERIDLDGVRDVTEERGPEEGVVRHVALHGTRILALDGARAFLFDAEFPGPGRWWAQSGKTLLGFRGDTVAWAGADGLEVTGAGDGTVRFRVPGPGPGGWFGRHLVWGSGNGFAAFASGSGRRGWRSPPTGEAAAPPAVGETLVADGRIDSERVAGRFTRQLLPVGGVACGGGMAWLSGSGSEVVWWQGEREP